MNGQAKTRGLRGLASFLSVAAATVIVLMTLGAGAATTVQPNSSSSQERPSSTPAIGVHTVCELSSAVASTQFWTPVILLNSPYGGNSSVTQTVTYQGNYGFTYSADGSVSTSTSKESGVTINAVNGASWGYFQLDGWTIYSTKNVSAPGDAGSVPCSAPYAAEIVSTSTTTGTYQILAAGTESDAGEPTSIYENNYYSVVFHNGYTSETGLEYNCGSTSWSTSTTTVFQVSIAPTISYEGYSVTGQVTLTVTTSTAYHYTLGVGEYAWQSLDGASNMDGALAFDLVSQNC